MKSYIRTKEIREKNRKAILKYLKTHSPSKGNLNKKHPGINKGKNNGMFGKIPWNKNKTMSKQHIKHLSESHMGQKAWNKYNITKYFLIKEYIKNQKTAKEIANQLKCNFHTILRRLKQYNIKTKNSKNNKTKLYPIEFNNSLKESVRDRDNHKCRLCGCPEIECLRKLDVHHIDYDKNNCNPENLVSLCRNCNVKVNFNRKYWKEYFKKKVVMPNVR